MIRIGSLFSGCGGLDLGLAGGFSFNGREYPAREMETVFACDKDRDALATLLGNAGHGFPAFLGDVADIPSSCLPDMDLLAAGFPCQPFSTAGKRLGVRDPRGTLFSHCVRVLRDLRPACFVFENVAGILSSKTENGTPVADLVIREASSAGYSVIGPRLFRADDYGICQTRKRVFFVGFLDPSAAGRFRFPDPVGRRPPLLGELLDGIDGVVQQDILFELEPVAASIVPHVRRSWKDVPYDKLPPRLRRYRDNIKKYKNPVFYRRHGLNEVAGTLTASAQPERGAVLHPVENRRYTVREAARIQSFPDDFVFYGHRARDCMRVIGNAVPPVLGWWMGKAVEEALLGG